MWWRYALLLMLYALGATVSDVAGGSWLIYLAGAVLQIGAITLILHLHYCEGFKAGVGSVPLDGVGLASGDDRAFDPGHRWNADLGAWEKHGGGQ
jgi:hypothetical protein